MATKTLSVEISPAESGQRLDRVLSDRLAVPRNQIQQWIRDGRVLLAGERTKAAHTVAAGEIIECRPPERDLRRGIEPEAGDIHLLHEDDDLVVLDKPAGLVVHPGAGRSRGTLVHRLLTRYPEIARVGGAGRPGIVHRLDKDTSGVMIVARSTRAYESLARGFSEREIAKHYLALAYGAPPQAQGTIDAPIARHPTRRKEMAVRDNGRPALTLYSVLASESGISALDIDLRTGRTHQIRVHLKSLGHPLIGDPVYGEARWKGMPKSVQRPLRDFARPALHAMSLELTHPATGETMRFAAPLPEDLCRLWQEVTDSPLTDLLQPSSSESGL